MEKQLVSIYLFPTAFFQAQENKPSLHGQYEEQYFPGGFVAKILVQWRKHGFHPWVRNIPKRKNATHASILTWETPWTEDAGGL